MLDDVSVEVAGGVVADNVQKADLIVEHEESDIVPVYAFVLIRTG